MKLAALLFPLIAAAQATETYERVLVPLVMRDVPGAFGTRWSTEVAIRNEGESAAAIFDMLCLYDCTCGGNNCLSYRPTAPHSSAPAFLLVGHPEGVFFPGRLYYLERSQAQHVYVHSRLFEESQRATEFGIEVPVVREHEFLDATTWLINIPSALSGRIHLRLYGVESPSGEGTLRVRIYRDERTDASLDREISLQKPPTRDDIRIPARGDFNAPLAGYSILALTPETTGDATSIRIRIDPITPGLRYWAMASITSNTTQNVTLVTPQ